jgi:hypothetical protein
VPLENIGSLEGRPVREMSCLARRLAMSANTLTSDAVTFVSLLKETAADEISCLAWWKKYGSRMPLLANVARSVFSITATSAPAERLFSRAGLVITSLRTAWGMRGWHRSSRLLPLKNGLDIDDLLHRDAAAPKAKKARVDPGAGAGAAASASLSSETAAVVVVDDDDDGEEEEGGVDSDIDSEPLSALVDSSPPPAVADDDTVQTATTTAAAKAKKPAEMKFPWGKHDRGRG